MVTVLVVDDDPGIRNMLQAVSEDERYRVLKADHGGPALDQMRQSTERLVVILGPIMPYVDGESVLREVAANPDLAARHRIVMVTAQVGLASTGSLLTLRERLGVPLVPKPFTVDQLMDAVAQAAAQLGDS